MHVLAHVHPLMTSDGNSQATQPRYYRQSHRMLFPHIKRIHGMHSVYAITPVRKLSEQTQCIGSRERYVSHLGPVGAPPVVANWAITPIPGPPPYPPGVDANMLLRLVEATLSFPPVTSPRLDFGTCTGDTKNAQTIPEVSMGIWAWEKIA